MNCGSGACWSSVTKKLITGVTGLALIGFLIGHLIGNLTLFAGSEVFNAYAHFLSHFMHGAFIWIFRIAMLAFFGMHIVSGLAVTLSKKKARPVEYYKSGDAGGKSLKSKSSMTMAISGLLLLVFVVLHLFHFTIPAKEMVMVHGEEMKDVYSLVILFFSKWYNVVFYVASILFLGSHLLHGVWSAFQSLGLTRVQNVPCINKAGRALSGLLAFGFIVLPVIIFLVPGFFDEEAAEHAVAENIPVVEQQHVAGGK